MGVDQLPPPRGLVKDTPQLIDEIYVSLMLHSLQ